MKLTSLIAIAMAISSIGSCSWSTSFFVVNSGRAPVHLEYSARSTVAFPEPAFIPKSDLKHLPSIPEPNPPAANVTRRKQDSLIVYSMQVPPDTAVEVFRAGEYTGTDELYASFFAGLRLSVETSRGQLRYEGGEIPRAFRKLTRFAWILEVT